MVKHSGLCQVCDLGRMEYHQALELQQRVHAARWAGSIPDTLLLVEHPPVITLGERADRGDLLVSPESLAQRGISLMETERGGQLTYHGPGQLVGYPILDLRGFGKDVHRYVFHLEEALISLLATYGLAGERRERNPGVWVGDAKIAFIGVFVRRWVTMHGFSLNIVPDLDAFSLFHPCGLPGLRVTALEALLGTSVSQGEVRQRLVRAFHQTFGFDDVMWSPGDALIWEASAVSLREVTPVS